MQVLQQDKPWSLHDIGSTRPQQPRCVQPNRHQWPGITEGVLLALSSWMGAWGFVGEAAKVCLLSSIAFPPWEGSFTPMQPDLSLQRDPGPQLPCRKLRSNRCNGLGHGRMPHHLYLPTSTGQSSSASPNKQRAMAMLVVPAAGCHPRCLPTAYRQCPLQPEPDLLSIRNALCCCLGWSFYIHKQPNYICSGKNGKCGLPWPGCQQTLMLLECPGATALEVILNFSGF